VNLIEVNLNLESGSRLPFTGEAGGVWLGI
jgi:hypothetical protein